MDRIDIIKLILLVLGGGLMTWSFYIKNNNTVKIIRMMGRVLLVIAILIYILNIIMILK